VPRLARRYKGGVLCLICALRSYPNDPGDQRDAEQRIPDAANGQSQTVNDDERQGLYPFNPEDGPNLFEDPLMSLWN
jgi:hypothetical protein